MEKLRLSGISKRFGDVTVVDQLNLTMRAGEFVSLLGPSGCGKTTTLRMIAGFIAPTAGTVELDGRRLSSSYEFLPPEKRRMSMIFQSYALWPNMTVEQNVAFGLKMRKVPKEEMRKRTAEILDVVRLGQLASRYPNELSGGQQQRVSLARALVVKPEVLLLDEPLSNLDANLREEMRGEIRRLHNEFGITSIYVTHDQAEAMTTSDRIAIMSEGRIEQIDDPLTLYNKPKTRYVAEFIGRSNILDGKVKGEGVSFCGFDVPSARLKAAGPIATEIFSLRSQNIGLHAARPANGDSIVLPGSIVDRSFLGETWDYALQLADGSLKLRVTSPPTSIFDVGQNVFIEIDPANIVPIQEDKHA
ncbi:ABC transporter ATP-binding protein [Bradyrhizobium sp. LHD-71]|uniref:ABC transporter ATP-binding protein n=1 Tax=Bradyrhizobium sp. LHD-71 TaxID=3072141 RepID=UPI00280DB498|nr:ABC transporter ATP-binding protein [Bradyrhizobium sp. LHD-71]MDQ8729753.1 ABC transporter ATP-binding protein [Bradyrhizobium sp. LHD-71]